VTTLITGLQLTLPLSSTDPQYFADYIVEHCLLKPERDYFFGKLPGTRYASQYYLANALYNQDFLARVAEGFYQLVEERVGHFNFQLTGRAWSAIPLLVALPAYLRLRGINVPAFMIKRERKTYGIHNFVEGQIDRSRPVLIVDDLCNSTNSFIHCRDVCLKEENLVLLPYIFAVLNKYLPSRDGDISYDRHLREDYKTLYLCHGDDIRAAKERRLK